MRTILPIVLCVCCASVDAQQSPPAPSALPASAMPVREVTVFKDGHAYVLRDAPLPADAGGRLVLDELPRPVLGTFWPFADGGARLVSVTAARDEVEADVPAVDMRQIARANVGKQVVVLGADGETYEGTLLSVPSRDDAGDAPSGDLMLLQAESTTRVIPLAAVRQLVVRGEFDGRIRGRQQRERLTLRVDGGGPAARVGLMYVQQGLRWLPSYRIEVDGAGKAVVALEATLVNDLVDIDCATVHLVIGVPKFEFAGMLDPIALQQEVAQVAQQLAGNQYAMSNLLSNSIRSQGSGWLREQGAAPEAQPTVEGGSTAEDLFVFTVRDVTLKKGECMVLPVSTTELAYRDVYRLDVPLTPPVEMRQNASGSQAEELLRELSAPKVRHVLRLGNGPDAPLTTAPALVLRQGRVLAQGRMRYAPKGASCDLEINVAVDVRVQIDDQETGRDDLVTLDKVRYRRLDQRGSIRLENGKAVAIEVDVVRLVLGLPDEVDREGQMRTLDPARIWDQMPVPPWWSWWHWPWWWYRYNGFGEFRWQVQLAPGASVSLGSRWHYFWQ